MPGEIVSKKSKFFILSIFFITLFFYAKGRPILSIGYLIMGNRYEKSNDFYKASKVYQKANKLIPDNLFVFGRLIRTLEKSRQCKEVLSLLDAYGKQNTMDVSKFDVYRASCYAQQGQLDNAEKYYKAVLVVYPKNPDIVYNLALTYSRLNRDVEAVKWLRATIELSPSYEPAHAELVFSLLRLRKFGEALQESEKWIAISRDSASGLICRFDAAIMLNDFEKAKSYGKEAFNLDISDSAELDGLISVYEQRAGRRTFEFDPEILKKLQNLKFSKAESDSKRRKDAL